MSEIKIFSFFSGSGFLDLGFEKSGYKVEFVNEFFEPFLSAYKYSREKMHLDKPKYGYWNTNINEYLQERKKELKGYMFDAISDGSLVGFIGGPPCPDFSVGGKNKGRNGDNGKLSLSYVNLITEMQPDFFLFENVKGLWRTKRHRQFYEELKKQLHNHGYCTTERLTNSLEFGVPQDRDRILLVGIKSSLLHDNKEKENNIIDFPWLNYVKYDLEKVKKLSWPKKTPFMENSEQKRPLEIINELTVEHWFEVNDVLNHPNSSKYFIPRNGIVKMRTVEEGDVSKKCFKRLHRWRYSPTAAYGNNEVHLHPYKCRRLSVAEALAIQSLPRDFSLPNDMTLSNMFKTIGNGVPFLLSVGIARSIKDYLSNTGNRREYKMERVTGYNLISYINQLPKNITYNYVNPSTKGLIKILSANLPNGPIVFKRWDPSKGGNVEGAKIETISSEMVWRLANAFVAGQPVNVDRIFGGSYNTRSVLESLVAHTPQFYYCYPGRIMDIAGRSSVERGHKHLVWSPLNPHENGKLEKINTDVVISEIPVTSAVYDALYIPDTLDNNGMDIDVRFTIRL